jgi:small subunit ribosomal protein S6
MLPPTRFDYGVELLNASRNMKRIPFSCETSPTCAIPYLLQKLFAPTIVRGLKPKGGHLMAKTTGKLPGYETTFITRVDLSDDALKTLKDRLFAIVTAYGGELVYEEDWGKRKFAYPIEKETRGQYTYFVYTGRGDVVAEIERNLRLHESLLRFMTIVLAKEFDKEAYAVAAPTGTQLKREERPAGEAPATITAIQA